MDHSFVECPFYRNLFLDITRFLILTHIQIYVLDDYSVFVSVDQNDYTYNYPLKW